MLTDELDQRLALHQLHRDEVLAIAFPNGVDGDNVGVVQRGRELGLPLEPFNQNRPFAELFRQDLQRHLPIKAKVKRTVDDAHPAPSQFFDDLVLIRNVHERRQLIPRTN